MRLVSNNADINMLTGTWDESGNDSSYKSQVTITETKPPPSSIKVRIASNHPRKKQFTETNFGGSYAFVETLNDRPVYKRNKKTSDGDEIYIWYNSNLNSWRFTD